MANYENHVRLDAHALFARAEAHFAIAIRRGVKHLGNAFEASSPNTSRAAFAALFFARCKHLLEFAPAHRLGR